MYEYDISKSYNLLYESLFRYQVWINSRIVGQMVGDIFCYGNVKQILLSVYICDFFQWILKFVKIGIYV